MSVVSLKEAKARFSLYIEEAAKGKFVTVTRHGKPAAVIVAEAAKQALKKPRPNFGEFLMAYSGPADLERNSSSMPETDFERFSPWIRWLQPLFSRSAGKALRDTPGMVSRIG